MAWITPKINWAATDYYNFADLNRVENNTDYIYNLLLSIGYSPVIATTILTRINSSIDYYDSINRIESNILELKAASYEPLSWITPKTNWASVVDAFDYSDANRLESNLSALKTMIDGIIAEFEFCGAITCGQDFNLGGY